MLVIEKDYGLKKGDTVVLFQFNKQYGEEFVDGVVEKVEDNKTYISDENLKGAYSEGVGYNLFMFVLWKKFHGDLDSMYEHFNKFTEYLEIYGDSKSERLINYCTYKPEMIRGSFRLYYAVTKENVLVFRK